MIRATMAVMALILRRDRPALILMFVLPPLVFVVFTAVFRETSSHLPTVTVAMLDAAGTEESRRLADAVVRLDGLRVRRVVRDEPALDALVGSGAVDAGLVVGVPADDPKTAPMRLLVASARRSTAQILQARLAALQSSRDSVGGGRGPAIPVETVASAHGDPIVLEEAGAIAAMFLMLAAIQVAAPLVDERESGIYDRVASSGRVDGLLLGKFGFGILVGIVQAALVMAAAAIAFGADVLARPVWLAVACGLTAAVASSLTLLVAACCSTRHQAQTISTFGILVVSTLGGSMVPAKLMPPWLADLGRFTPNSWSIAAFEAALKGDGADPPLRAWAVLATIAVVAVGLGIPAFRRRPLL